MQSRDVVGERFEIERRVGSGGMGEVFRAWDRAAGEVVAVKVLLGGQASDHGRFAREAEVLAGLSHPGIVRYVAHGMARSGEPYLVMEWLSGEDLAKRLERGALTVDETMAVGVCVAAALGAAHARGVVHRDLKPSNLLLVENDVRRVKVLDFGIARRSDTTPMTRTGAVLGTPGYMAPEQARGSQDIDARSDVFALGSVLFECLTGAPLFTGEHLMGILAKILFQEAPRVNEIRQEVSPALGSLIARMLAKERDERPPDGAAVVEALEGLSAGMRTADMAAPLPGGARAALTGSERRVLSVVMMGREDDPLAAAALTLSEAEVAARTAALRERAETCGGHLTLLADGSMIVTIRGAVPVATDQAAHAARCALSLCALAAERPMTLATGRAEVTGKLPMGDAIDRAAQMLANLASTPPDARERKSSRWIAIDEVTAGLLDARFEVVEGARGFELRGERAIADGARTLLGKPTACVGRDWELATLEGLLTECMEEPMARVVLVTAPAGLGKSRLAYELMDRVKRRGDGTAIWLGRGDSLRAGSPFGLLGQALRGALGMQEGQPLAVRRDKIWVRVAEHVVSADQRRVAEFLGELVSTPFSDDESAQLIAARQDAQLMGDQTRRAWVDFLQAQTAAHPVLLILEDLHWGDFPTVRFIDAALRDVRSRPWMVLALARPEVHAVFPGLWAERRVQEIRLKELTRKASARLIRQVLGDSIGADAMERIVNQAEGHAFYLEELIRAVAEGKGAVLPETVLAMVEARLAGLDGEARRVLRAASVFGEVFWQGGVAELLGSSLQPERTEDWLTTLVEQEVLIRRVESQFPGEAEFAFRHALLREGSYATLTGEDRALGHRLAGEWLSGHEETEPMVLAEHFERGADDVRAGRYYLRAAELSLWGGDPQAAMVRAQRSLRCATTADARISPLSLLSEAAAWCNDWSSASAYASEVMSLSVPGSPSWVRAVLAKLGTAMHPGQFEEFTAIMGVLRSVDPLPDTLSTCVAALAAGVFVPYWSGQIDLAEITLQRLRELAPRGRIAQAWCSAIHSWYLPCALEDPWKGIREAEAARMIFTETDQRWTVVVQVYTGINAWFLGELVQAEQQLRSTMAAGDQLGPVASHRNFCLARVLLDQGNLDEAKRMVTQMIEAGRAQGSPADEGRGRWAHAEILRRLGDLRAAEQEALAARDALELLPLDYSAATASLAAIQLAQGRAAEAVATAEEAMARYEALRAFGYKGAFARLVQAEALYAAGHHDRARAAMATARDRLLTNAAKIGDASYRRSFLENVPENARTLALARAWLGEGGGRM